MASARAHASTSDPQQKQQPSNCGATSVGHASLVSFARSASARNMPVLEDDNVNRNTNRPAHTMPVAQFGLPSNMGAAPSASSPSQITASGEDENIIGVGCTTEFERASAAMRASRTPISIHTRTNRNQTVAENYANTNVSRSPRVGSVPKRMREPMTVESLTGMLHELPCPSSAVPSHNTNATAPSESNVFGGEPTSSDTQKRRRTAPSVHATDIPPPTIDGTSTTDDAVTDDLCFLVDQVALKEDVEKEQKFMPYIV